MASITITTTAAQDARIAAAFTAMLYPPPPAGFPGQQQSATVADVKAWLIQQLTNAVLNYERLQAEASIVASPLTPT